MNGTLIAIFAFCHSTLVLPSLPFLEASPKIHLLKRYSISFSMSFPDFTI